MFLQLRRENSKLKKQLKVQAEQLKAQEIIINELKIQITDLTSKLAKNSNNSHKPPTSDNLSDRKQGKKNKNTKGKKSSGGQKDHKGVTLQISSEIDEKIIHSPEACDICGEPIKR